MSAPSAWPVPGNLFVPPNDKYCHNGIFWINPYFQMGPDWTTSGPVLIWFSPFRTEFWSAEWRFVGQTWQQVKIEQTHLFSACQSMKIRAYAVGTPYKLGEEIQVRLLLNGCEVAQESIKLPQAGATSCRIACFGDFAEPTFGGHKLARVVAKRDPSVVVMPGDITYARGRVSEYRNHFFPQANEFLRTRMVVPVVGNHDISTPKDYQSCPDDLFAFFQFWNPPVNGPTLTRAEVDEMVKNSEDARLLLQRLGDNFLKFTNYSFDWCNTHWLCLDSNHHIDWSNQKLRTWLRNDLATSQARWKFVVFHHPGFNSDWKYRTDQRMRTLCGIFEETGVDAVFGGHCHFYERHRPLRFRPSSLTAGDGGTLDGVLEIDSEFDGVKNLHPKGVIYIVTGAGGKIVADAIRAKTPSSTTAVLLDGSPSFTELDVNDMRLTINQINDQGAVIDTITIDKRPPEPVKVAPAATGNQSKTDTGAANASGDGSSTASGATAIPTSTVRQS